jgi:hypothetical protein
MQKVALHSLSPQPGELSFDDWWAKVSAQVDGQVRQDLNSIAILGAWSIWNHRNRCVFMEPLQAWLGP